MSNRVTSAVEAAGSGLFVAAGMLVDVSLGCFVAGAMCWLYVWRATR